MHATDYNRIAKVYDNNPIRFQYDPEPSIELILSSEGGAISILDLACGTGIYLLKQRSAFSDPRIHWYGCDLSQDMLDVAKSKLPSTILLTCGDAQHLPYTDCQFNFISCNFAFHHFVDKPRCIKELNRVLRPHGSFKMYNTCPEAMRSSWVYHYFKGTRKIDTERFWSRDRIRSTFTDIGFEVRLETTITEKLYDTSLLLAEAKNRDMSQLNLISEAEYQAGLSRIEKDVNAIRPYDGSFALLKCTAMKRNG